MSVTEPPFPILRGNVLTTNFAIPLYVMTRSKWYLNNFNSMVVSTTRFPAFDIDTKTLSVNLQRRNAGCSPVEIMEVYVAVLWQTLGDVLEHRASADIAVLMARSAQIYQQEYVNTPRIATHQAMAHNATLLRTLLEKRDTSSHDAANLTKYISTLHPTDYYEAMLQNFDFFDSRAMPAIFHLFVGLITNPDNVSIYGLREIVLEACIERCARHIGAVRVSGLVDINECYNEVVDRAAKLLVPVLRKWSFVLDCLTLFCAPTFLNSSAAQVAKQIGAYSEYANTYVKDENLRGAMEAVYPGIAKISNVDIVEMLMRAGECSSKTRFNATELFKGDADKTLTRFDILQSKAATWAAETSAAAEKFVMDIQTCSTTAIVPLNGRPHFFSSKFAFDTTLLALNHFALNGNKEMYNEVLSKTPEQCRNGRRFHRVWEYYHDDKARDNEQKNSFMKRIGHFRITGPTQQPSTQQEEKEPDKTINKWSIFLESQNTEARAKAREVLFMIDKECCICFEERGITLKSCCIVSSKHQVCTTCFPMIFAGKVCPLCRSNVM
jgi:hypothetical protein